MRRWQQRQRKTQPKYRLTLFNRSGASGGMCLYQRDPVQEKNNELYSLAWFARLCHPRSKVTFTWRPRYSFVWSEVDTLRPGVIFFPCEGIAAEPADRGLNAVTFLRDESGSHFERKDGGDASGLTIDCGDIPENSASVGIAVSGSGAFAWHADANSACSFSPNPEYWIAFGDFVQGEVVDVNSVAGRTMRIDFAPGEYEKVASFGMDSRWTLEA